MREIFCSAPVGDGMITLQAMPGCPECTGWIWR